MDDSISIEKLDQLAQLAADRVIEIINQFNLKYPDPEAREGTLVDERTRAAMVSELLLFLADYFVIAPPSVGKENSPYQHSNSYDGDQTHVSQLDSEDLRDLSNDYTGMMVLAQRQRLTTYRGYIRRFVRSKGLTMMRRSFRR